MSIIFDKFIETFLTKVGDVMVQTSPPKVRAAHCRKAMAVAEAGMIICRKYSCYLDGMLIPGEYTHSGIVEDNNTVIHAIAEGVSRIDILDFVKDTDGFIILDPVFVDKEKALIYARSQVGKPYDFKFEATDSTGDSTRVTAFFCHELTAMSLKAGGLVLHPIRKKIGPVEHDVYLAEQFIGDARIKLVYEPKF